MTLRTGLLLLPSRPVPEMAALVARAEALGYDDVWLADERFFREVYATLTVFAQSTRRVRLGPCVTDPYSRHPALTAMANAVRVGDHLLARLDAGQAHAEPIHVA